MTYKTFVARKGEGSARGHGASLCSRKATRECATAWGTLVAVKGEKALCDGRGSWRSEEKARTGWAEQPGGRNPDRKQTDCAPQFVRPRLMRGLASLGAALRLVVVGCSCCAAILRRTTDLAA
eukprot:gene14262-biopygen18622